jgi:hypothetical protein
VAFVLVTIALTFTGKVIYVDDDGPADFNTIQAAIDDSSDGDIIIVAEGRYFENINFNGRNITLTSTDPCNPDVVAATIIDGNQNGSVVTFNRGEDANCVLNGFTITNGNAEHGGGMLNFESSPTITNCIFSNNSADFGGGMYNEGSPWSESNSNPTLTDCAFIGNSAERGGGMYNMGGSPTLTNCIFTDNSAIGERSRGAGMYSRESSPTLTNCTFSSNSAEQAGGGMFIGNYLGGQDTQILNNCAFSNNSAEFGGGMFNFNSSPTLKNCTFSENSATREGGGVLNLESNPTLTNCTFSNNVISKGGGGMYNHESSPILVNCIFTDNVGWGIPNIYFISANGGGMYNNSNSNPTLNNCTFNGNSAWDGGAMYNNSSGPTLTNCTFSANSAEWGGGILSISGDPMLINCALSGNSADKGGAMYNIRSNLMLKNCTFALNSAAIYGSAVACDSSLKQYPSNVQITNCILWDCGYEIWNNDNSTITVTYSDILGGWSGEGNMDADPCFVQPGYWDPNGTPYDPRDDVWIEGDYHLLPGSTCIDAGDPDYVAEPNETDLDGKPRVKWGRIDMGAYEFISLPAEVRIIPQTINLNSKGKWITCYIWLPEGYDVADIDPDSVLLEDEIQPDQFLANEQQQDATAIFSREEVQAILNIGEVELAICVHLTNGTIFEGTDVIKVVQEGGGKLIQASNPNPADGATNVSTTADLSWTASPYATSHNVYFGTSSQPPFIGNQTVATFDPGTMDYETTYYWHIDEVNKWGITTGQLWRFTTLRDPGPGTGTTGTGTGPGTTGPTGPTGPGTGTTGPGTAP